MPDLTANAGAPTTGQDAQAASSTAQNTTAPAGPPSRGRLLATIEGKTGKADDAAKAAATDTNATSAEPRDAAAETNEGKTEDVQAGKPDDKGKDEQEPKSLPKWVAQRLAKEKDKRTKVESELSSTKLELKKRDELFQLAVAENERLAELLQKGQRFDEKDEALHALQLEQKAKETFEKLKLEHETVLKQQRREEAIKAKTKQLVAEIDDAVGAFPLVSKADIKERLRENPKASPRQIAEQLHQEREALALKRRAPTTPPPDTVAKPTGRSGFQYPLGRKGLEARLTAMSAKS